MASLVQLFSFCISCLIAVTLITVFIINSPSRSKWRRTLFSSPFNTHEPVEAFQADDIIIIGKMNLYKPPAESTPQNRSATVSAPKDNFQFKPVNDTGVVEIRGDFFISMADQKTPPYDPRFKNPCWFTGVHNETLMCTPYVFVAGFPKCGTTDLNYRLLAHPYVSMPSMKENLFFNRHLFSKGAVCSPKITLHAHTSPSICYYANNFFKEAAKNILLSKNDINVRSLLISGAPTQPYQFPKITVDSSTTTLWENVRWPLFKENWNLSEPRVTARDLVLVMNPNVKIVIIMRDPVSRAYSDYLFLHPASGSAKRFHQLCLKFFQELEVCLKKDGMIVSTCVQQDWTLRMFARLHIGLYYFSIKDWLEKLPPHNLLIMRMEDYRGNIAAHLKKVYEFLEIPPFRPEVLDQVASFNVQNRNTKGDSIGPMLNETKKLLSDFYAPYNEELAKLLKDDRFLWKDPS